MVKRRLFSGVILSLALATPLAAAPPTTAVIGTPPQPGWSLLNAQQKAILAPLGVEWDKLDNISRKKWLGIAERYPTLKPDEQRRLQDRMREWVSLTPEQRAKVRDTYKEFNQLPSEQKQTVKQKWEAYSNLPPEEKQRIRQSGKSVQLLAPPPPEAPPPAAEGQPDNEASSASPVPPTTPEPGRN
ncbi:DUF3106 domain-containing protein [Dechloromonas sp. H13]|uniref:DUF3106 domain-containing protein n=1 Tax=Dechloromonas sp. H13 TaxID=2570193 RepID=UPI001290F5C1|nr:DUF3106 domain-containing protein [Dechloromonas sp. H13]